MIISNKQLTWGYILITNVLYCTWTTKWCVFGVPRFMIFSGLFGSCWVLSTLTQSTAQPASMSWLSEGQGSMLRFFTEFSLFFVSNHFGKSNTCELHKEDLFIMEKIDILKNQINKIPQLPTVNVMNIAYPNPLVCYSTKYPKKHPKTHLPANQIKYRASKPSDQNFPETPSRSPFVSRWWLWSQRHLVSTGETQGACVWRMVAAYGEGMWIIFSLSLRGFLAHDGSMYGVFTIIYLYLSIYLSDT